jgi:hypothetical protein
VSLTYVCFLNRPVNRGVLHRTLGTSASPTLDSERDPGMHSSVFSRAQRHNSRPHTHVALSRDWNTDGFRQAHSAQVLIPPSQRQI